MLRGESHTSQMSPSGFVLRKVQCGQFHSRLASSGARAGSCVIHTRWQTRLSVMHVEHGQLVQHTVTTYISTMRVSVGESEQKNETHACVRACVCGVWCVCVCVCVICPIAQVGLRIFVACAVHSSICKQRSIAASFRAAWNWTPLHTLTDASARSEAEK